ncbi:hypothetical protein [Thiocystis violacea]|uniref:hypothetical protein n=1 Tax=Thiocystis violacea TaxID=13725 RepID=UPI001903F4E8|nr:hypothetical protein [Thiocystis violacea]MBK1724580.1 hypothetical protein [Thiocystis violacea]
MSTHLKWFRRAVWLGILGDWVLTLPVIFAPEAVLDFLGLRATHDPVWTAFAGLLVFLLSLFYIPGANKPYRYKLNAWFAVLARPPGVLFFLVLYPDLYPPLGIFDAVLFLLQFPLLLLVMAKRPAEEPADPTLQAPPTDRNALWLKRTLWAGIVADLVLGLPAIFWPEKVLDLIGMRQTLDPVWTAFAGLILVLLAIFYIPGANQPYRYRFNAIMAVLARPPGILFFFWLWPDLYPAFGYLDTALFLAQFPFLVMTLQLIPERRFRDTQVFDYRGTSYRAVKEAAFSGPYETLPFHKGLGPSTFLQFLNDSARNMHDRRDIRPRYDKLIHAMGVCYAGIWEIDTDSPYTGYFAKGAKGLLVARASVAGPLIKQGHSRSFGIAGKVFPTMDPDAWVWPGNFVTVSDLSGSRAPHVLDIEMTNFPKVGTSPVAILINRVIFRLMDTRPGYRQLFPLSTLGVAPGDPVVTPDLMRLRPAAGTPRVNARDFRDEIRLSGYPGGKLVYDILVKDFGYQDWKRIGTMTFTEDTVSEGSDKQLHFWIPRDIPNLPKPAG